MIMMLATLVLESQEEKMMKLDHVLEKLRSLDPKTFGLPNSHNQRDTSAREKFGERKKIMDGKLGERST